MEETILKKTYELAYHIIPDIEMDKVKDHVNELEKIVEQNGGGVVVSREPRRIHLSYPIEHKHYAYFGVLDFTAPTDSISTLDAQLKLQDGILRYMILAKPKEDKELHTLADKRKRAKTVAGAPVAVAPTGTPEEEAAKRQKMEAEIEDVLGKI